MSAPTQTCKAITASKTFELAIAAIILVNVALVGLCAYTTNAGALQAIETVQRAILGIFTLEILVRFLARENLKAFFSDGWNLFDLALITLGFTTILFKGYDDILILRLFRLIRILRLLRITSEVKLIATVLTKSLKSLVYNGIFFFAFIYLFAAIGHTLFKLPDRATLPPDKQEAYDSYMKDNANAWTTTDAYGSLDESMFTLFRVMTGDDWTTIRYSLHQARDKGLIPCSRTTITLFHVGWFSISAFLLLNLLVGAVVNNYQGIMDDAKKHRLSKISPSDNDSKKAG
jgi:voltage-gated sodium channel